MEEVKQEFLNLRQAADFIGVHENTLVHLSKRPDPPPRSKLSRNCVRYSRGELIAWMRARSDCPGPESGSASLAAAR